MNLKGKDKYPSQYLFGKISISNLLQSLQSQGIATDKVEEPGPGNFIIHLGTIHILHNHVQKCDQECVQKCQKKF